MHAWATAILGISGAAAAAWEAAETAPHPEMDAALNRMQSILFERESRKPIMVGDSLCDIPREEFWSIKSNRNLSLSGQTTGGYCRLIRRVYEFVPPEFHPSAIVTPCFGNNGWFAPPPDRLEDEIILALSMTRRLFPDARIIIPEFPPSYSPALQVLRPIMAAIVREWMQRDENAVVISFEKFGGWNPSVCLSSDGVHFTPEGVRRFDAAIVKAIKGYPSSIVTTYRVIYA
jgi:lysophospholipase L1-like esterase